MLKRNKISDSKRSLKKLQKIQNLGSKWPKLRLKFPDSKWSLKTNKRREALGLESKKDNKENCLLRCLHSCCCWWRSRWGRTLSVLLRLPAVPRWSHRVWRCRSRRSRGWRRGCWLRWPRGVGRTWPWDLRWFRPNTGLVVGHFFFKYGPTPASFVYFSL